MVSIFDDNFLPPELVRQIPPLFTAERTGEDDPMVWAKFVSPITDWRWYVVELAPSGSDLLFLGWVIGLEKELGTFFLSEMLMYGGGLVLRDDTFQPCRLSEVYSQEGGRY